MITLTGVDGQIDIDFPEHNYISRAHLAISPQRTCTGWETWNNDISRDYRTCLIPRFIHDEAKAYLLWSFLKNNQGNEITMDIGTDSNFFPFGPDKGDSDEFIVRIINRQYGTFDQFKQFTKSLELLLVSAPDYSLPSVVNQGSFQIGTVQYLLYPQLSFNHKSNYSIQTGIAFNGEGKSIDHGYDSYETSFVQQCNTSLAAKLFDYLTGTTGRHQDITIIAGEDYYMFGPINGDDGTYTCKLIQNVIECKHVENEQFEIPLNFYMKSAA